MGLFLVWLPQQKCSGKSSSVDPGICWNIREFFSVITVHTNPVPARIYSDNTINRSYFVKLPIYRILIGFIGSVFHVSKSEPTLCFMAPGIKMIVQFKLCLE